MFISSFTECVRQSFPFSAISFSSNIECNNSPYEGCTFNPPRESFSLTTSASFTSCTFTGLTSNSNGGAIAFVNNIHGVLNLLSCIFIQCRCNVAAGNNNLGGGSVCVNSPSTLYAYSCIFIGCTTPGFGGGIFAERECVYSTVILCTFVSCSAEIGGGMSIFFGPSSRTSSCRFISCNADYVGGGVYHDCLTDDRSFLLTDSFFKDNSAHYESYSDRYVHRGGGAFEDYRSASYNSQYFFSFFTGNSAPKGVGNDISIHTKVLTLNNIIYCITTAKDNSLWNTQYEGYEDWLP